MKFLEQPAHPHGLQAELSTFLQQYRESLQNSPAKAPDTPVGGPVTKKVRELITGKRKAR